MTRVLVVDDSATARALLVEILRSDPAIQVVGEARDGTEALELTQKLRPDLITMDVRMPGLDGFAATKEIMIAAPTPIIIVTASFEDREVDLAMRALQTGALTALRKPPGPASPTFKDATQGLIATVKAMAQVKVVRHWRPSGKSKDVGQRTKRVADAAPLAQVVAIAASTGGPGALQHLLSNLPGDFPVPILIVQHNAPGFMTGLARWLDDGCELRVKVAEPGESLLPGWAYLAPDDAHLGVTRRGSVLLADAPRIGGFRPSGTYLFDSVAQVYGAAALALVLTGMGDDGLEGLRAVRHTGGRIIAQDESSSVVWGMPGAAVAAGLPDLVLPLDALAARVMSFVKAAND